MPAEPSSPLDPMTVRLVGGPFHGRILHVPGRTAVWEIIEPGHWRGARGYLPMRRVPDRRHRYRLDPHWREFVGQEPLPFVYVGVVNP